MGALRTFDVFHSRLILRGTLIAESGLHPGAGGSLEPVGSDSPVLRDAFGRPYIPGSSFKGVLRSTVERLIRGIHPGRNGPVWSCDVLKRKEICVSHEYRQLLKENEDDEKFTQTLLEESCSLCRLFGSPWLASKVLVKDLYCVEEWQGHVEIRDGVGIDRDTETASPKVKYDYEVVPRGTEFDLELVVENAEEWELGMLFVGLREFAQERAFLGGLTSRGLGRVRLDWRELEQVGDGGADLLEFLRTGRGKLLHPRPEKEPEAASKEVTKDSTSPSAEEEDNQKKEEAFELLAKVILALEQESQSPSIGSISQKMEKEHGFHPQQIGLRRFGKDFIPAAQEAGWVQRAEGDIVHLTEEGRSRLQPEETKSLEDPPDPKPEQEASDEKETFIEDFIDDKIAQLIQRIKGGGSNAQTAA